MEIHGGVQCYKITKITTLSRMEDNVALEMSGKSVQYFVTMCKMSMEIFLSVQSLNKYKIT